MPLFQTNIGIVFFAHIPKCAGMSVERVFSQHPTHLKNPYLHGKGQLEFPCSPQHFHAEIVEKMFSMDAFVYCFTLVRNPYERILSEYRFRSDIAKRQKRNLEPFDTWLQKSLSIFESNPYTLDNHLRPQIEFLTPNIKIFKFENGLENIFSQIEADLPNLIISRPSHTNKSKTSQSEMSIKSRETIQEFYKEDFSILEYPTTGKVSVSIIH